MTTLIGIAAMMRRRRVVIVVDGDRYPKSRLCPGGTFPQHEIMAKEGKREQKHTRPPAKG